MVKLNFIKTVISVLLITVFWMVSLKAQTAKQLFENNHKWGINVQLNNYFGSNNYKANSNNYYFKINSSYVPAVGVRYNFLQTKNWNFNAGFQVNFFGDRDEEFIAATEITLNGGWWGSGSSGLEAILYVPITAEYIFPTKQKVNYSLGAGLGMSYYQYNEGLSGYLEIGHIPISSEDYIGNGNYFTSGHIMASMYFKSKGGTLFQASLTYKKSFKDFRKGEYSFTNLQQSPDITQKFSQSGDFIGLSLTTYFKKKSNKANNLNTIKSSKNKLELPQKKTTFGFKAGVNSGLIIGTMLNGEESYFSEVDLYASFFVDTQLNEKWNLENEILFSYTGWYHFAEIPVHLKYKFSPKFNILFGPKLDFLIGNVSDYENRISKYYGVSLEIGTQYKINNRFFVELRYAKSFTKQFDIFDFLDGKRNTLRLGMGVNF